MKKEKFLSLIENQDSKSQLKFKRIYNLINDVRIIEWDDILVTQEEFSNYKRVFELNNKGEDLTFEIGYRYFRGNKMKLSRGVFVPQFDTETIIDIVLEKGINQGNCLEVGTGTGAIAISLAHETKLFVTSIDINPKAIDLAKENNENNNGQMINFVLQDYFKYYPINKFDLLISNPPYISKNDPNIEDWVIKNQPKEALFANDNGLLFYKSFFNRAKELLNIGGYMILEIGYSQAEEVVNLAKQISTQVEVKQDYNGYDRFVVVKYEH